MSAKVYKDHYAHLVKMLPMDDPIFIAELYSCDVLADYDKELILSRSTRADRALVFLDNTIQPSVHRNDDEKLHRLLKCMEKHEFMEVKKLAWRIKQELPSG